MSSAEWVLLGVGAGLALVDVLLLKSDRELLTDAMRRHKGTTLGVLLLIAAHVLDILGPADPFRLVGRLFV